ncbi:MAG: KEOPS complex subunit Cgi121 [Candidatus Nitrosocaldus sp.]
MMLRRRLSNNNRVYHTLLTYIDLSIEEPEGFMKSVRTLAEELHKGIIVQVINADNIAGLEHLLEVLAQSLEAERRSCLLAKRVEVDMLLRLACTRQISDAIESVGLKRGRSKAVLVVVIHEGDGYDSDMEGDGKGGREDGERDVERMDYYNNMLMRFKDRLKAMDGVIRMYDDDGVGVGVGGEEYVYKHMYERLTSIHGLSEQELASCISSNRLVSILAERANLLHR